MLIDLSSSYNSPSNTVAGGVILRERSARTPNSRPSSLLLELETLKEDSKEDKSSASPSPRIPALKLFDFSGSKSEASDGTVSPQDNLRERTASSDTITYDDNAPTVYDDLPTPTPFSLPKKLSLPSKQENPSADLLSTKTDLLDLNSMKEEEPKLDSTSQKSDNSIIDLLNNDKSVELSLIDLENINMRDDQEASLLEAKAIPPNQVNDEGASNLLLDLNTSEPQPMVKRSDSDENILEDGREELSNSRDDLSSLGSREDLTSSFESMNEEYDEESVSHLRSGMAVRLAEGKTGVIRFIGPTKFSPGAWIGVELDKAGGRCALSILYKISNHVF